jgi:Fic family protein
MRIIKRRKGREFYYYLQHSYRKDGKIITKEKYLGKEIPKDVEETKAKWKAELSKDIYKKLKLIRDNFQNEWKKLPESVKAREKEEIAIAFTYNTNAIEGSTITLEDAREIIHDKISPNKPIRDVRETEAHSKVFLLMLGKKESITNELILRLHREIFSETKPDIAGEYRDYLVRIGSHLAPDWQEVKKMMSELIDFVHKSKLIPVELAARVHYKFEKIHPFGDGNGRVGRLLMNQILWHASYPMLIIEYKKRRPYYRALQKDEEHFVNYFMRRYLAVHKKRFVLG